MIFFHSFLVFASLVNFFALMDRRHIERHPLGEKKKIILVAVFNCEVSLWIMMTYFWAIQRERTPIFLWSFLYIYTHIYIYLLMCCCCRHLEKEKSILYNVFLNENMVVSNIRDRNVTVNIRHRILTSSDLFF